MLKMSMLHISACIKICIKDPYREVHKTDIVDTCGCWKEKVQCVQSQMAAYTFGGWVEQETQKYTGS